MATLRERQKELTRQALLDAGFELFVKKGYGATTIEDIASAAGTTRVTFYAYFPSRGALLKALLDERLNERLERTHTPEQRSRSEALVDTVATGTREAFAAWISGVADSWPDIHPLIRMGREAGAVDVELGDLITPWLEEPMTDIEEGLTKANRFEPWRRHFLGVLAMAELDYVAQHWGEADWGISREQMLATLVDSWYRLLGDHD